MDEVRIVQAVVLRQENSTYGVLTERFGSFSYLPRRGDTMSFAFLDAESGEERDIFSVVDKILHEVWKSGEVYVTLTMEPFEVSSEDELGLLLHRLEEAGFSCSPSEPVTEQDDDAI